MTPYGTSVLEPARRIWRQLCIAKGEKILTINGPKNIENINKDDIIFCWNPITKKQEKTKVVAQKYMGKKDVFKLKTSHRSVSVTDNHRMLVFSDGKYIYKEAKDLQIGKDVLVLPFIDGGNSTHTVELDKENYYVILKEKTDYESNKIMEKIDECNCTYSSKNIHAFLNAKKRIPYNDYLLVKDKFNISESNVEFLAKKSPKKSILDKTMCFTLDSEFAKFFGFMLGDGWLTNKGAGFATGVDEKLNEYYKNLLEKYSNSALIYSEPKKGISGGKYEICSVEFKDLMETLEFSTGALNKNVPSWIFEMSVEARRSFIQGYFDADGGKKDGRATSISFDLLKGIQELAYTCGIPCNDIILDRPERIDSENVHRFASYRMYINMNKESWQDNVCHERILSFSLEKENEETFDIQVESEHHNFIVNGVVAHNCLMEDAMMSYRIVRSPERRVFYVDVGNISPNDVEQYMQKIITQMKRNQIVDPQTGRVDLRYNPMSVEEDYYLPVRGQGSGTKIETLPGGQFTSAIEDVKYLRDKLLSALKIPQAYLARGEGAAEDKTMLAQKDMRFATTIQRLQNSLVDELTKIGMIHLYTLGFRNEDLVKFSLKLNNPSRLAELQEIEHFKAQLDVAGSAKEQGFSKRWIYENIFKMADHEFLRIQRDLFYDAGFTKNLEAISPEGAGAEGGGSGGSSLGGGLGGSESPTGAPETPEAPETGGGEKEAPPPAGEPGNPLLAAPARREDIFSTKKPHLTSGARGKWYTPVNTSNNSGGARTRSIAAKFGSNMTSKLGNSFKKSGFGTIASGILPENIENNVFEDDEKLLIEVQSKLDSMDKYFSNKKKQLVNEEVENESQ